MPTTSAQHTAMMDQKLAKLRRQTAEALVTANEIELMASKYNEYDDNGCSLVPRHFHMKTGAYNLRLAHESQTDSDTAAAYKARQIEMDRVEAVRDACKCDHGYAADTKFSRDDVMWCADGCGRGYTIGSVSDPNVIAAK